MSLFLIFPNWILTFLLVVLVSEVVLTWKFQWGNCEQRETKELKAIQLQQFYPKKQQQQNTASTTGCTPPIIQKQLQQQQQKDNFDNLATKNSSAGWNLKEKKTSFCLGMRECHMKVRCKLKWKFSIFLIHWYLWDTDILKHHASMFLFHILAQCINNLDTSIFLINIYSYCVNILDTSIFLLHQYSWYICLRRGALPNM